MTPPPKEARAHLWPARPLLCQQWQTRSARTRRPCPLGCLARDVLCRVVGRGAGSVGPGCRAPLPRRLPRPPTHLRGMGLGAGRGTALDSGVATVAGKTSSRLLPVAGRALVAGRVQWAGVAAARSRRTARSRRRCRGRRGQTDRFATRRRRYRSMLPFLHRSACHGFHSWQSGKSPAVSREGSGDWACRRIFKELEGNSSCIGPEHPQHLRSYRGRGAGSTCAGGEKGSCNV